jgi:hypothetical protein
LKRWILLGSPFASGTGALFLALALALVSPREALTGWLAAFVFCSTAVGGGLFFVMLADVIPGSWRVTIREPAGVLARGQMVWASLSLPVLLGMSAIFPWFAEEKLSGFRAAYLAPLAFTARLVVFCGVCIWLQFRLTRGPQRGLAIGGLILFILLTGIFSTDVVLSLDPEFHSSGFGLYFLSIQALTGFAAIVLIRLAMPQSNTKERFLLGALFLTLLLCWAYFDFMQYFILWSGNLPARADWFLRRSEGGWHALALLIVSLRLVPAFLLLFPPVRESRSALLAFAGMTLAGTLVEIAWLVMPELEKIAWAVPSYLLGCAGSFLMMPLFRSPRGEGAPLGSKRSAHEGA